eukprot:CCRYP_009665-RA/>CCRYP_009665-RA protein AED:0.39 eAED:-0.54 QI:0/0/0/0.33/1/1/3/0/338
MLDGSAIIVSFWCQSRKSPDHASTPCTTNPDETAGNKRAPSPTNLEIESSKSPSQGTPKGGCTIAPPSLAEDPEIRALDIDPPSLPPLPLLPPVIIPTIPTQEECAAALNKEGGEPEDESEFKTQFYANIDRRLAASREKSSNSRPLFKTREEAQVIIGLIKNWRGRGRHKRQREEMDTDDDPEKAAYVRRDYRVCQNMGHARTARNILTSLKESWFGITQADVQLVIDLCPVCVGNTSRIRTSQTPLKMIFSPTIGHRAQVDLIDMCSNETQDGYKWIVRYRDHHSGKCDVGATKGKTAEEVAPVIKRIMASNLVPNVLQSDNGGEFLGETVKMLNK